MDFHITTLHDLKSPAVYLADLLNEHKIIALEGQMGAGKTTFVQTILKSIGVEDLEGSPTYSLINEYQSSLLGKVYHLDLYRLNSIDEVYDIGIEELLYQNVVCFIEWPEKMQEMLPDNTIWVYLRVEEDLSRIITIKHED
jgi:tRNA threonylcarbamoyladenosine biosynthesis protein TsaE